MTFDHPANDHLPQLLGLWKQAFGDWNGFWELFLRTGFSPLRCRCILDNGQIAAALTWLNCSCEGQKMAYLYAVVTHPAHRGLGLCRRLLEDTHAFLKNRGYHAALLVPAEPGLRSMYEKLGYETCSYVDSLSCLAEGPALPVRTIGPQEFSTLRRKFLPPLGVWQEEENLPFLAEQAQFYTGDGFLMAAYQEEDTLSAMEFLGNFALAPGILQALGAKKGSFRCHGNSLPFAMVHPLTEDAVIPAYFGFAFD